MFSQTKWFANWTKKISEKYKYSQTHTECWCIRLKIFWKFVSFALKWTNDLNGEQWIQRISNRTKTNIFEDNKLIVCTNKYFEWQSTVYSVHCTLSRFAHQVVFVTNIFLLFFFASFCTSSNSRWNYWYAAKSKIQNTTTTITVTVAALALPCHTGKFIRYWFGFCWMPVSITQIVQT